jgi:hypothetical protein
MESKTGFTIVAQLADTENDHLHIFYESEGRSHSWQKILAKVK